MATSIADAGSPLDDYFKDNGESSGTSSPAWTDARSGGDDSPNSDDSSGEITLVNSLSPTLQDQGWTDKQRTTRSSSLPSPITPRPTSARTSSNDLSPPGPYVSPRQQKRKEAEAFAERFKYLICSSGLLEKEWVPGLGREEVTYAVSDGPSGLREEGEDDVKASAEDSGVGREFNWVEKLEQQIRPRRDLQAAVGVLILAIAWTIASTLGFVGIGLLVLAALVSVYVLRALKNARGTTSMPEQQTHWAERPVPVEPASSFNPHSALLASLATLLASSRKLDSTLDESMRLLPPNAPISHQRALRTSLHRLCNNMTDHLASTTSSLLEIVDKRELAALAVMYDIPMAGGLHGRKLSDSSDGDEPSENELPLNHPPVATIPSPRRPLPPSQSLPEPPSHLRALSMSATHSLPGRFRPTHSKHLSLTPSKSYRPLLLPRTAVDDRFTQLPNRTPRLSTRASWDQEAFEAARNEGIRPDWAEGRPRDRSRPRHERRITEDDEEVLEGDISGSSEEPGTALVTPALGTVPASPTKRGGESKRIYSSPPVERFLPQRRSPLSGDPLPPRPASIHGEDIFGPSSNVVGILPSSSLPGLRSQSTLTKSTSKPPMSENPKRRSLQSMTYYPSTSSVADDFTLMRTNSLPPSDLQALRVASARSSRRPSFASSTSAKSPPKPTSSQSATQSPSPPRKIESANATVRRVVSLSPLTLPALKAACLGVHLKRRKMACCLLGLNFAGEEDEEGYWQEVDRLLAELASAMDEERASLVEVMQTAEKNRNRYISISNIESTTDESSLLAIPPWRTSSIGTSQVDFAPRDNEATLLHRHVLGLQRQLGEVWEKVAAADQTIRAFDIGDVEEEMLSKRWMEIREGLGGLVREWERGREIISSLGPPPNEPSELPSQRTLPVHPPPSMPQEIPSFMQAWTESLSGSDDLSPPDKEEMAEDLPPPGLDQVFEATPDPSRRDALRDLPREERIRLTKEAREKGLTVAELISDSGQTTAQQDEKERMKAGGMVVKELEGMIGLIRRRKGQPGDAGTSTPTAPASETSRGPALPITARRVSRERALPIPAPQPAGVKRPENFLEDLQQAFVFPKRDTVALGEI